MYYKDLDSETRLRFVKEVLFEFYPFTIFDFVDFENKLDFQIISKNQYINWDYEMVEKYKEKWDWNEIENNPIICKEVNLGFLYPDKVKMSKPICNCFKKFQYCERNKFCNSEYDRIKMQKKYTYYLNQSLCRYIRYLINEKFIDHELLGNILLYDLDIDFSGDFEIEEQNSEKKPVVDYGDLPF